MEVNVTIAGWCLLSVVNKNKIRRSKYFRKAMKILRLLQACCSIFSTSYTCCLSSHLRLDPLRGLGQGGMLELVGIEEPRNSTAPLEVDLTENTGNKEEGSVLRSLVIKSVKTLCGGI